MIGLIVSGHGNFADGLLSAAAAVVGPQDHIAGVNFLPEDSGDLLRGKLLSAIETLHCDSIAILTDISGGTPFHQAVMVSAMTPCHCRVFSGTNMPLLLGVMLGRQEKTLDELVTQILDTDQVKPTVYQARQTARPQLNEGGI